jgi:small subunit ribosomal protein S16
MVRIRLCRTGRKNLSRWRVGVFDKRTRRDGKAIEYLGFYEPHNEEENEKIKVDQERVQHWLARGAQPTDTVASLLRKVGIQP